MEAVIQACLTNYGGRSAETETETETPDPSQQGSYRLGVVERSL